MSLDKYAIITDQCTVTVISTLLAMYLHKKLQEYTTIIRFITFSVVIKNKIVQWFLKLLLELGLYYFTVVCNKLYMFILN